MVDKKKEIKKVNKVTKKVKKIDPNAKVNLTVYLNQNPIKDYYINALIVATFRSQAMTIKEWSIAIQERIDEPMGSEKKEKKVIDKKEE